MNIKKTLLTGLAALAIYGCASTAKQPSDQYGKIDSYRNHIEFIHEYGWALNTIKPIDGAMIKAPGVPRVYVVSKGEDADNLRRYAWDFYRDSDAWMYFQIHNPELKGYGPDEILPAGTRIPAQMLEWQIMGFDDVFGRKIIPQDSTSGEFFKNLKWK